MTALAIFGAKYLVFVVAALAALIVWRDQKSRTRIALIALMALPLGYILVRVVGMFFGHHQPFAELGFEPLVPHDIDNSFPSDHTFVAGAFASLALLSSRRAGLVLWLMALLVGLSRVAAGLHWPEDVFAAALIALVSVLAVDIAVRKLSR